MKYFLTSNPCLEDRVKLNNANYFVDNLKKSFKEDNIRCTFICSNPDSYNINDMFANEVKQAFENVNIYFESYNIVDGRTLNLIDEYISTSNLIILAGGHVPTQNDFFINIDLREKLNQYDDVIVGISAGSMNSADIVYVQPELEGESSFTEDERFRKGLSITSINIIPHYEQIKNDYIDGLRVFEDITYKDSIDFNKIFYAINDGSYIYGDGIEEYIYGEAFIIENGEIIKINNDNSVYKLK